MIRRGEVRWYRFARPDKRRPIVVLTRDAAIGFLDELTVAPVTTTIREIPSEVHLGGEDGMPRSCAVNLDHVQTVPKAKVEGRITAVTGDKMEELCRAMMFALGFDET